MRQLADTLDQWEAFGPSFARARPRPWPAVVGWAAAAFPAPARLLDLGAGHGRHGAALAARGHDVLACDFAASLLAEARRARGLPAVRGEAGHLPLRSAAFDGAIFVAALHNVPGRHRRLAALAELRRVLRPGGRALVTVWARWRPGWLRHFALELPHHVLGDASLAFGDALVPWTAGDVTVARYYHMYSRPELRADVEASGLEVVRLWGERLAVPADAPWVTRGLADNLFVEVRRPAADGAAAAPGAGDLSPDGR